MHPAPVRECIQHLPRETGARALFVDQRRINVWSNKTNEGLITSFDRPADELYELCSVYIDNFLIRAVSVPPGIARLQSSQSTAFFVATTPARPACF
jgi:hypothetical protein